MNELTQLRTQLTKLANARTDRQRAVIEKSVLLWGTRLYRWTKDTEGLLERQLAWLDAHPTNDQRFDEWTALLKQYEQAIDLLRTAERSLDTPIALQVAA